MKILMICGIYAEENEEEVLSLTKGYAEQSANIFQRKLIKGIQQNDIGYKIISAPLIGAFPMRYRKIRFAGFSVKQDKYEYVQFNNIWGIRNLSRTNALKKAVKKYFEKENEEEFLILVYCPHTPFLEAAVYAKYLRPKSKICLVVPDLPQYMNLNESRCRLYDMLKKYDIEYMERFIAQVDSFVLLTEQMKEVLKVGNRPYIVAEGLVDDLDIEYPQFKKKDDRVKRVVYTGKMNAKFGIKNLVDSFIYIDDIDYRFILCGDGDAKEYIEEKASEDPRIKYKGLVSSAKAREYMNSANVLVNPRLDNEEYTKYSFPSKNIEYLLSGKPVVAYMLSGIPEGYNDFFCVPEGNTAEDLSNAIIKAASLSEGDSKEKHRRFVEHAKENLKADKIIQNIIKINH